MFGIGFSELVVISIILIVAVGPNRMPGMLKAAVRAYREFRKATRELRASTGIDEILQDEDLRSLRKPLYVPPAPKPAPKARSLTVAERRQESPIEGVDLAEISAADKRLSPEEAERVRQEKIKAAQSEVVQARPEAATSGAKGAPDDADEREAIRAAKVAAAERPVPAGAPGSDGE